MLATTRATGSWSSYVNVQCEDGWTALHHSADFAEPHIASELLEMLLSLGANPHIQEYSESRVCLHIAVQHGHTNCVRVLLESGTSVDLQTMQRGTSKGKAIYGKPVWSMHQQWRSRLHQTALHIAASNGHVGITKQLIEAGAIIDSPNFHGETPLALSLKKNRMLKSMYLIARSLKDNSEADQKSWESVKKNVFQAEHPCEEVARLLVANGAQVERLDAAGEAAMGSIDCQYWYKSKRNMMLAHIGNPAFANPHKHSIFRDKRTQHAVEHHWRNGQRRKILQDIVWWLVFVVLFIAGSLWDAGRYFVGRQDISLLEDTFGQMLVDEEWDSRGLETFFDIRSVSELHEWATSVFVPELYPDSPHYYITATMGERRKLEWGAIAGGSAKLIGSPRLRQLRSSLDACSKIFNDPSFGPCVPP